MTLEGTLTEKFTRRDYMRLPEGFPAELIEGDFVKEPPPTPWHQGLVVAIAMRLVAVVGRSRVLVAPTDVSVDDWNVLQPDVLVRAPGDAVTGPSARPSLPVLVVEVISPSTARRDRERKTAIYLRAGVEEVWLVDPDRGTVEVHTRARAELRRGDEAAESRAVPGVRFSWNDLSRPE